MSLILIAALSENNVIGKDGKIPWHIREDIKHFKELTMGHPVIMGRKTYESIPADRRPLAGRKCIVISSTATHIDFPGAIIAPSFLDALIEAGPDKTYDDVFVIGGEDVYNQGIPEGVHKYLS